MTMDLFSSTSGSMMLQLLRLSNYFEYQRQISGFLKNSDAHTQCTWLTQALRFDKDGLFEAYQGLDMHKSISHNTDL